VCRAITWVSASQPCGNLVRCLVGECNAGQCPAVLQDGQPCNEADLGTTCDTFSSCIGGICRLLGDTTCP
jgi:hypothetical protein